MKMPTASKVNIDAIENKNMRQHGCCAPFERTAPYKEILPEND